MGIFKSIFGSKNSGQEEKSSTPWITLNTLDQLNEIEALSQQRPQLIFKHSTSCGISTMVLRMFKDNYSLRADEADLYYLDLHSYRQVSNEVVNKFGVYHQSPQLIIIKNKTVVGHSSHGAISEMELKNYI